jgi:DNA repair exonuclease SbcCD nuclease subunit
MISIFASGDNHLGKTLKMRKSLREIGINNFKSIPDKIKNHPNDIDYVVFPGDVFDKENTDIQSYYAYASVLKDLIKIESIKKIMVITGNHDQYNEYFSAASIDIGDILESEKIVVCNKNDLFYFNEEDNILFCLLPYNRELFLKNEVGTKIIIDRINDQILKILNTPEYKNAFKVLVSHFAIEEWMPFSSEVVSKKELRAGSHYDLIILSDLHNETYEDHTEKPNIVYTGSTMHTTITDLYNHKNSAKVITIDDGIVSSEAIEFHTPPVILINKDNFDDHKKDLTTKNIVITDDFEIHNNIKDRVLYSMYKPKVSNEKTVIENLEDGDSDVDSLDVHKLALKKIEEDELLDDETKNFLKFLVNIDVGSTSKKDLADMITNEIKKGL